MRNVASWALQNFWHKLADIRMGRQQKIIIGDDVNYAQIDVNGILLVGTSTNWDDLRVPVSSQKVPATGGPGWVQFKDNGSGSTGVFSYQFDADSTENLYFTCQIPHAWKEGSDLSPHIHWCPTTAGTGSVVWELEYTWANISGTFGNTTVGTVTQATGGAAYVHKLAALTDISGTGKTHSSMLVCRLARDADNGADTYGDDAALLEVDFHYEMYGIGDREDNY